jgi:predicted DNA binding protein
MPLYELGIKLQHECVFNNLSKQRPALVISHWCNSGRDILEISCDDLDLFQSLQQDIQQLERSLGTKIIRKSFSGPHIQVVIQHCACAKSKTSLTPVFEKHNILELQPCVYKGGWEYYRLVALSDRDVRNLFHDIEKFCTVEVLSRKAIPSGGVKEHFMISTNSLFGELTGKQLQALVYALENGYYRVPKKVTTEEMAKKLRLPRTTYEEHLRKAESKVLQAVTPYIQMGT